MFRYFTLRKDARRIADDVLMYCHRKLGPPPTEEVSIYFYNSL